MIDIKQVQAAIDGLGPIEVAVHGTNYKVEFQAKASQSGNVQIVLKDMRIPDLAKVYGLMDVETALSEAGFNCDLRLTFKGQDGSWQSFPCVWVNEPRASTDTAVNDKLTALERQITLLTEALLARGHAEVQIDQSQGQIDDAPYEDSPFMDELPL